MAIDYLKVLDALECETTIVGRTEASALMFKEKTGKNVFIGGLELFLRENSMLDYNACIVAVGIEQLKNITLLLLANGAKKILLEKPGARNLEEVEDIYLASLEKKASIYIAYNRRYYSSAITAQKMIVEDGGPTSFQFEFTEWSHKIEPLDKKEGVKEAWFIGNSTHVVDLAFYLGGKPEIINSKATTPNSWHSATNFVGSGQSLNGALFSYHANWHSPGRWSVEIMTRKSRYVLRPLEELKIQKIGSIELNSVEIDNKLDLAFKPGLFLQTKDFLENNFEILKSIKEQVNDMKVYEKMLGL